MSNDTQMLLVFIAHRYKSGSLSIS